MRRNSEGIVKIEGASVKIAGSSRRSGFEITTLFRLPRLIEWNNSYPTLIAEGGGTKTQVCVQLLSWRRHALKCFSCNFVSLVGFLVQWMVVSFRIPLFPNTSHEAVKCSTSAFSQTVLITHVKFFDVRNKRCERTFLFNSFWFLGPKPMQKNPLSENETAVPLCSLLPTLNYHPRCVRLTQSAKSPKLFKKLKTPHSAKRTPLIFKGLLGVQNKKRRSNTIHDIWVHCLLGKKKTSYTP